jgi:hypothetical protein
VATIRGEIAMERALPSAGGPTTARRYTPDPENLPGGQYSASRRSGGSLKPVYRMKSLSFSCALAMIFGCAAFGQSSEVHHHNFTFGFGGAVPTGSDTAYLGAVPMISFGYGYRFNRLFRGRGLSGDFWRRA